MLDSVDLPLAVALISVAGAVTLASVGYVIGRRERLQAVAADPGLSGPLRAAEPPPPLVAPDVLPSSKPLSLNDRLSEFAREHQTGRVAVFDASGLVIRYVGLPPDPRIGAVIGSFAACLADARASALLGGDAWVELSKLAGSSVRCRVFDWNGQMLVVAALDTPPRIASVAEQTVLAAAPALIASG